MKILVTTPLKQDVKKLEAFNQGVKFLKKIGHNVSETGNLSKDIEKDFNQNDKLIKDSDIMIAEVTNPDSKVGPLLNFQLFTVIIQNNLS